MSGSAPVIRLRSVGHRFGSHEALRDLDLTVHAGQRLAVLGTSGAGKSTLLALLNGSLEPTAGSVEVFGENPARLSAARRRQLQRRIGSVSQEFALIEQVRVLHNVNAGRLARWSTARALASMVWPHGLGEVREALDRVGLGWALHERTERLSGGERQRVAIARLLVQAPELVVADEPVASLDPVRAAGVLDLLGTLPTAGTLVVSLHQPSLAREHCTRVVGLRQGQIVLDRPAADVSSAALDDLYALA
ncbi:phosphonate transport system ATP-binding protein [Lipingzhangella halophila]|uniref:Phosphonate transport system ATP-binding protein n=1 Tax=Lipingzhangella halophila TaxID=1783352 RepID=A0A7W7REI8_9ACTN|nr:ATP-binding cassette domain-containing protein [Lipingzhangella halophila]MBB4930527.1 phosphonate transport system ATP-binding protein [Lipingzhangella halophila]